MKNKRLIFIIGVGLMAALVFVGNYLQVKIPNGVLVTRIHFGNSMCLLAGLIFGPIGGGLASGIGAALYDLIDPVYIISAPFTFLSKFAMGFVCGALASRYKGEKKSKRVVLGVTLSAVLGQITYIVFYLSKTYFGQILLGAAVGTALTATATNALTSTINAVISVLVSVPLFFALKKPLKSNAFGSYLNSDRTEKVNWSLWIPLIVGFVLLSVGALLFYTTMKQRG